MKCYYRWGGFTRRLSVILFFTALSAVLLFTPAVSQTYDIILIEKPRNLTVYDAFQQSTTSSQLSDFLPFVPIKILKARDILGDGFTRCMKVEIGGKIYFLLIGEEGRLAGWNKAGEIKTFKDKECLDDTITVLVSQKIPFRNYVNGRQSYLSAGDRCVRYFRHDGSIYVQLIGKNQKFGWIKTGGDEEGKIWKIVQKAALQPELSAALRERITGRIQQVNRTLTQIYSMLNTETRKGIAVPQWQKDPRSEIMGFVFMPEKAVEVYPQSVEILKSSLQTYLLGTNYNVVISGNRMEIKQR